ncbi:hypothetical protein [Streptococcus infantarius]|uniref:hypothetical protein n=1 Tax=Streptococcus infantarius TaxID=102684 RepID=UPI0022E3D011|nr:hypothetical protein [Streptococcus infantarius]
MANKRAPECCVIWNERHEECSLDVLMKFREWTNKHHLKSNIEIAEMLNITPNEARKYLDLAKMPKYDSAVLKRMKVLMNESKNI